MIHGGRYLRSEFVFDGDSGKTTGTGLIGFEPQTGLFTSVWIDSRRTGMSLRRSKDRFDGRQIVLHGAALQGAEDARKSRTVTRLEENGSADRPPPVRRRAGRPGAAGDGTGHDPQAGPLTAARTNYPSTSRYT
jgi:hypothetical protein